MKIYIAELVTVPEPSDDGYDAPHNWRRAIEEMQGVYGETIDTDAFSPRTFIDCTNREYGKLRDVLKLYRGLRDERVELTWNPDTWEDVTERGEAHYWESEEDWKISNDIDYGDVEKWVGNGKASDMICAALIEQAQYLNVKARAYLSAYEALRQRMTQN